jgi:hypothetical protein
MFSVYSKDFQNENYELKIDYKHFYTFLLFKQTGNINDDILRKFFDQFTLHLYSISISNLLDVLGLRSR